MDTSQPPLLIAEVADALRRSDSGVRLLDDVLAPVRVGRRRVRLFDGDRVRGVRDALAARGGRP